MKLKYTVLVVEDDMLTRTMLRDLLESGGYDVVEAVNGEQALRQLFQRRPDIILMDVMMPVMDGKKTCQRLKGDPGTADIPILMVTAQDSLETVREFYDLGADGYLVKPPNKDRLLREIDGALRKAQFRALHEKKAVQQPGLDSPMMAGAPVARNAVTGRIDPRPMVTTSQALLRVRKDLQMFLAAAQPLLDTLKQRFAILDAGANTDTEIRKLATKLDAVGAMFSELRALSNR